MPLKSDIQLDTAKFCPTSISGQTAEVNKKIIRTLQNGPKWYEIGVAKYRQMRRDGKTAFPLPELLPEGLDVEFPSREAGRNLPCRLFYPSSCKTAEERKQTRGTVLHIHGGGWVLGDQLSADSLLKIYADTSDLAVISIGYRLAPESPFPSGPEDCFDVAEYLVQNSEQEYGGPLRFIGGESAGANLSVLTTFHLLKTQPSFNLSGLLLHFGVYDLSFLPSAISYTKPLLLNHEILNHFRTAYLSATSLSPKDPTISPYYEDWASLRGKLPPALFTCGTDDPLLDDSVNMGVRWCMMGAKGVVKVYAGAAHGFIAWKREELSIAGEAVDDTVEFIRDCMATV